MSDWLFCTIYLCCRAEPILAYIKEHPNTLVLPVADAISEKDMRYMGGPGTGIQGFSWAMLFQWLVAPPRIKAEQNTPADPMKWVKVITIHASAPNMHL